MESFKIFGKLFWYLSVVVIFLFYTFFEGFRIYDYIMGNYEIQVMKAENFGYDSSAKRKSMTIYGYIGEERVYFYRFDADIKNLYNILDSQFFTEDNKKTYEIKVLKFKHSHKVMTVDDDEFPKWERGLLLAFSYITLSIIIILILKRFFSYNYLI